MSAIREDRVNRYIEEVCSYIKNKKVHSSIKEELLGHIDEIIELSMEKGSSEEEAINQAILRMGEVEIVGRNLNKAHKNTSDWALIAITGLLILFGIFATSVVLQNSRIDHIGGSSNSYVVKTIVYLIIGSALSLLSLKFDYRILKRYSMGIYFFSIVLNIFTLYVSDTINGAKGWLIIGPFTINISTITSMLLVLSLAGIFDSYNWSSKKSLLKGLTLAFAPMILFLMVPSMVTCSIYLVAVSTVMVISGLKLRYLVILATFLGSIFSVWTFSVAYRLDRITSFLNPASDPEGAGWIYNQLDMVRGSAKFFGKGTELASLNLPEAHTDFMLASIIYCFGWSIGIILIAVVLVFIIKIGFIAMNTKNSYGKLIVSGLCSLFTVQFILSLLSNLSLSPLLAVSMPFISYGGSQLVISIISISIINNVYKQRNSNIKIIS